MKFKQTSDNGQKRKKYSKKTINFDDEINLALKIIESDFFSLHLIFVGFVENKNSYKCA